MKGKKICFCLQLNLKKHTWWIIMLKKTINHSWKAKTKSWLNSKNNYSKIKNYGKPKHYWHKINKSIRQAKTFSQVGVAGKNSTRPLHSETAKTEIV